SIYDDGIGNLDEYKGDEKETVNEIPKKQNRRDPQLVIDLANKLRTDGIIQEPSTDPNAPNMVETVVKQGTVLFLHSTDSDIGKVEKFLEKNYSWDFSNSKETKELNLTHNLIADKAGFRMLMDIYARDQILKFRDRIKNHIKNNGITTDFSKNTFGEVIQILQQEKSDGDLNDDSPTNTMQNFINDSTELYNYATSLNYSDIFKMYVGKDQLLDDKKQDEYDENKKGSKRDDLIKHLFKIQNNI